MIPLAWSTATVSAGQSLCRVSQEPFESEEGALRGFGFRGNQIKMPE